MSLNVLGVGNWRGWAAFIGLAAALAFPIVVAGGAQTYLVGLGSDAILATVIMIAAALASLTGRSSGVGNFVIFAGTAATAGGSGFRGSRKRWRTSQLADNPRRAIFSPLRSGSGRWLLPRGLWRRCWSAVLPKSAPRGGVGR